MHLRAESAYEELKNAWKFNHIIHNPFGEEDIENWGYQGQMQKDGSVKFSFVSKPSKRIMEIVDVFTNIMKGNQIIKTEHWEENLLK